MGLIYTRRGSIVTPHSDLASIGEALSAGETIVDAAGLPIPTLEFMGGTLVGSGLGNAYALPMNVILFDVWYPTQKELMQPLWDTGQLNRPPENVVNLPVVDPAADTGGLSSILPLAAAAAVAFFILKRKR